MSVEAIPIKFEVGGSVKRAAEAINKELTRGKYVGYIAVSSENNRYTGPAQVEGIVLLVDVPEQPSAS